MIPRHCREVALKRVSFSLDAENIVAQASGKLVYKNASYLVLNNSEDWAISRISKAPGQGLFHGITGIEVVALPHEVAYLERPEIDVQNVSSMVGLAEEAGVEALVVKGQFEHVSFVFRETASPLYVFDVVPPKPAKITELITKALATGRIRKAIRVIPEILDLSSLARQRETRNVVFPCYASGLAAGTGEGSFYLDQAPSLAGYDGQLTLIGCELSLRVFQSLYGHTPAFFDMCPMSKARAVDGPSICRCCGADEGHRIEGNKAYVPWGASVAEVEEAIIELFDLELEQETSILDTMG